jgi:uncharacterized RDD family membrane protein YckC
MTLEKTHSLLGHYAGFASRFLALIIDAVILTVSAGALAWTISGIQSLVELATLLPWLERLPFLDVIANPTPLIWSAASTAFFVFYHVFFIAFTGRTPGKAFMGLRILTTSGGRVSVLRATLRLLIGYPVSFLLLGLGFLWVLVDDYRQALHDKLAGTYVVYAWAARPDEDFLVRELTRLAKPTRK